MSLPPSAKGARRRDPEPSEPRGPGPQAKTCSSSCLSWLHPLRSWSLRQTRGGSVAVAVVGILFLALLPSTNARDLGQWENIDPAVREWYRNLKRPDFPQYSCCGAADAYWCDEIHVKHGNTYCTITDDRDDEP